MVVDLVGLGGSLEGRVARVVLVLVGCKRGAQVSHLLHLNGNVRFLCVRLISAILRSCLLFRGLLVSDGLEEHTGSKSGGERVDAVCDDQACGIRFSSPFSMCMASTRSLALSSIAHNRVLGYRTGGVERPHGLDCNCECSSALCLLQ